MLTEKEQVLAAVERQYPQGIIEVRRVHQGLYAVEVVEISDLTGDPLEPVRFLMEIAPKKV